MTKNKNDDKLLEGGDGRVIIRYSRLIFDMIKIIHIKRNIKQKFKTCRLTII